MDKEDLLEVLEDTDPEEISEEEEYQKIKRPVWVRIVALVACIAVFAGIFIALIDTNVVTVAAVYPEPVAPSTDAGIFMESEDYFRSLMAQILVAEDENTVCSPINTYISFAMLAEISEGNTRQQILDMLGAGDMDTLRKNVSSVWKSNYADTPVLKSLLANSLWLNRDKKYNSDTLDTLATQYYASAFIGRPGSREMDQALRSWTDENTGGLLSEYTKNMSIDPNTVLEILSTIYFKAAWTQDFREEETTKETFHGTAGDTMVDMMHQTDIMGVYRSDRFTSVDIKLNDSGSMFFILPNDDKNVNELASDPDIIRAIRYDKESERRSYPEVHLGVPKFKVSGKCDLIEALRKMGVTDAMDVTAADFTPLTTDSESVFLSKAEHAAMIETDEHGVTGAAYTELAMTEGAAIPDEEIDLVIDRPFMFIVTGCDGSILFSGIVRNID